MAELIEAIPYGPQVAALVVAISALVSAIVPDDKLPGPVAKVLNWLALNVGKAANDPARNGGE